MDTFLQGFRSKPCAVARGLKSAGIIDLRGDIKMPGAKRNDQPLMSWRVAMIYKGFAVPSVTVQEAGLIAGDQDSGVGSSTRTAPSRDNNRLSSFSVRRSVARHMSASNSCSSTDPVR